MFPISSIQLQFGATGGSSLGISDPAVTVFVGPNNSGKSLVLRELLTAVRSDGHGGQVLQSLSFNSFSSHRSEKLLSQLLRDANVSPDIKEDETFLVSYAGPAHSFTKAQLRKIFKAPLEAGPSQLPILLRSVVLDGSARLGLVNEQEFTNLLQPRYSFERLVADDDARKKLRKILYEAFGKHLVVDVATRPGKASLRYSTTEPPVALERSLTKEAIELFRSSPGLESMSDGVRAFTGILVELFAGDPAVLIIDEPEAFLHPSLAFLLGREISRPSTNDDQKNVFVATHSSSFLMGCVQSGAAVNVVRLTHSDEQSTARLLDANRLKTLMRNPLLRSVGAIEALFYDYVVVTEADGDRAFYDEINHRLVMSNDPRGIPNCLFLRAQNKHTVPDIVQPLRSLGIPAAGIVDVDVYKEGGTVWMNFMRGAGIDEATAHALGTVRGKVKTAFDAANSEPKRNGGVSLLQGEARRAADNLFDQLDDHGLLTVRHGEVETWLPGIANGGHGPAWLVEAFKNMGEDSSATNYLKPAPGDVWDFIGEVGQWLRNANRKGMLTS